MEYEITRLESSKVIAEEAADVSALATQMHGSLIVLDAIALQRMAVTPLFVARQAGRIMGMACLVVMDLPQGPRFLLESLVVHQDFRRKGVAKALINAALAEVKQQGGSQLRLTCNPTRLAALKLYESLSFEIRDTRVYQRQIK